MSNFPEGWVSAPIEEVVEIIDYRGRTPPYAKCGIPHLRSSNIKNGKIVWEDLRFVSDEIYEAYMTRGLPRKGDLLLTTEAPFGEVALAPEVKFSIAQRMMLLRPSRAFASEFLLYEIMSEDFQQKLVDNGTGTTVTGISSKNFKPITIRIAPINEQRRIVAKLKPLLDSVNAYQQRFLKIPVILKRFRQAVLAAACSGELTADWRESHPTMDNPETRLASLRESRLAKAKSETEIARINAIYEYTEEKDSDVLPEQWKFIALSKLSESFDYGTSSKSQPVGNVPVLRMGNIQNGEIDWSDLVYSSDSEEIRKYSLQPRTVIFNRTNSPELVGKTAIYRGERPAIFAGYLIRINHCDLLDPEYLNYCLNTSKAREFCRRVKSDGVSQSNINAQKLGTFEVPFCSIEEQKEIVRHVKTLFKLVDQIEARYRRAKPLVDKLQQSILAKAFRGEFVQTEAELARREGRDYEPASALLERLRSERAEHAQVRKEKVRSQPSRARLAHGAKPRV